MALSLKRIDKNIRKLRKIFKKVPKVLGPKYVHNLRTGIRRFETTCEAVGLSPSRSEQRLLRRLRRIRKKSGKVRDMDVLTSHLFQSKLDGNGDCIVQVFEHMGTRHGRYAKQLRRMMRRGGPKISKRLKRVAFRVRRMADKYPNEDSPAQISARSKAAESVLQLSNELTAPATLDRRSLHPYRMKIKKLRYMLQESGQTVDDELISLLGKCKDAIGEWHDWEELVAIAADVGDRRSESNELKELSGIRDERFESALKITNEMRKRYLHLDFRGNRRLRSKYRPSSEILVAAAGLAR